MLWSILKILLFLAIAAALAFAANWILETPGEVKIAFGSREVFVSPIGFIIGLAVLIVVALVILKIIGFLAAVVRFLLGDETAISRYFSRNRERRGFNALSDGLVAVATGDSRTATKQAAKAEKLLNRPDLTQLLSAQAAELSGDRARTYEAYKAMLPNDRTRPLALQGLTRLKIEEGDTDTAMALAKKAFALRPDNERVLRTLFDLQSSKSDWAGARDTLTASMHARLLPRDVGIRRDAVLSLADARAALAAGDTSRGNEAALQANRLAPTLVPAAALAAQVHAGNGAKRKATKALTSAWAANPHPDLAAAFAAIEPDETPEARRKRFGALVSAAPGHVESRLLEAELALAAEDFPAARKALGDLPETEPTTRSLALMAAIERGQGAPDEVVRGWLARALGASRGPQWICGNCTHVHAAWQPVCENCGAFDTLDWKTPTHAEDAGMADSALLPLIVGGGNPEPEEAPPPAPEKPTPTPSSSASAQQPEVEDAELASVADKARASGAG
jgi:HemY protein